MWEMPPEVAATMASDAIVFVKGDLNYRRLVGERDWALDAPFADICSYWPAPLCALRTLKAEGGCGMSSEGCDAAERSEPGKKWMHAGKYGVVQFAA